MTYTLSDLVKKTGAKRRAIQLWSDSAVLEAAPGTDRAGGGVHRLYDETELKVAALLAPLADIALPIGRLKSISDHLRSIFKNNESKTEAHWASVPEADRNDGVKVGRAIWRAERGIGQNLLCIVRFPEYTVVRSETDEDGPVSLSTEWKARFPAVHPAPAIIMLDLTALLKGLTE